MKLITASEEKELRARLRSIEQTPKHMRIGRIKVLIADLNALYDLDNDLAAKRLLMEAGELKSESMKGA